MATKESLTLAEVRKARETWEQDLRDNLAVKVKEIAECDERGKLLRQQRDEIAEELRLTCRRKPRKAKVGQPPAAATEAAPSAPAGDGGADGEGGETDE